MTRPHATTTALYLALLLGAQTAHGEDPSKPTEPAAASNSERAPLTERSQAEALALQEQLPPGEQLQLTAGEESFLALWQPANVSKAQGVVILLPGAGETADWPRVIGPLRNKLPNTGWHSLSLTLPDPLPADEQSTGDNSTAPASTSATNKPAPSTSPPADEPTTAEPGSSPSSEAKNPDESPERHAERILARLQAAIAFARQQNTDSIVLLGHGTGGYWAARYLSEHKDTPIKNLLLVAVELPAQFSPPLDELLPKLPLAIGDFYYRDQEPARAAARQRLQASKRQPKPSYIQIAMAALPGDPATEQEQLHRRIRGWLSLHVQAAQTASKP